MKEKGKDILVIALAALTVLLCLIVLFKEFPSHRELEALVTATPVPTEAPAPAATPEPTEAPEPTPEPTPMPNPNEELARAALAGMNTEEKVWQLIIATPESLTDVDAVTVTGDLMRWSLDTRPLGGLIYASRNTENAAQLTEMLADVKELAETPMFIAYDPDAGTSAVKLDGNMAELGFNLVIDDSEEAGVLHALRYTESADLTDAGFVIVSAALMDLPQAEPEEPEEDEEEDTEDEAPLGTPYCLSSTYVAAVREAAGDDTLLLTAPLYAAEGRSSGDLALSALLAGCDMIVAPEDPDAAVNAVLDAINAGELSESRLNESVRRILLAKLDAGLIVSADDAPEDAAVPVEETEPAPEVQDSRE